MPLFQVAHKFYSFSRGASTSINAKCSLTIKTGAWCRAHTNNLVKNYDQSPPSFSGCLKHPLTAGWVGERVSAPGHKTRIIAKAV